MAVGKHLGYDFGVHSACSPGRETGGGPIPARPWRDMRLIWWNEAARARALQPMPEPRGAVLRMMRVWDKAQWMELRGPTDCAVCNRRRSGIRPAERGSGRTR